MLSLAFHSCGRCIYDPYWAGGWWRPGEARRGSVSLKSGYPGSWVEVILSHQELAEMLRSQAATANQDAASGGARCSAADWPRPANQRPARISARQPQPLGLGLGVHSLIWLQHHTRGTAHCGDEELGTCLYIRINFYTLILFSALRQGRQMKYLSPLISILVLPS